MAEDAVKPSTVTGVARIKLDKDPTMTLINSMSEDVNIGTLVVDDHQSTIKRNSHFYVTLYKI